MTNFLPEDTSSNPTPDVIPITDDVMSESDYDYLTIQD